MESAQFIAEALEQIFSSPVECLKRALEKTCEMVDCEYGAILTVDKKVNSLEIDVLHGYPAEDVLRVRNLRKLFKLDQETSICVEALKKEKPVLINTEGVEYHFPVTPGIKRVLAYPIWNIGEIVAVLGLESPRPEAFRQFERDLEENRELKLGANLVGGALNTRQSLIFKFDEFIRQKNFRDVKTLSDSVAEWVCDKFSVDSCSIYFAEYKVATGYELVCKASLSGGAPDTDSIGKPFSIEEDYIGWVYAQNHSLLLPEYENEQSGALDTYATLAKGNRPKRSNRVRSCKSYLGVPIASGEQVLGVLEILDTEREYAFTDEALLEIIADDIAGEYLRISKEIRRENIFDIPNIETGDLQLVIRGVVDAAMRFTDATHGYYMSLGDDGRFTPRAVRAYKLAKKDVPAVEPDQDDLTRLALKIHDAVRCSDVADPASLKPDIRAALEKTYIPKGVRSLLMVPVFLKGKDASEQRYTDLGVLTLMSLRPRAFQEAELTISAVADIVSYHIWGTQKIKELEDMRANVGQLEQALSIHNKIVTASALSVGTVHTAKKHLLEMKGPINRLVAHKKVHEDEELRVPANKVQEAYNDLDKIYNRVGDVLRGFEPKFEMCDLRALVQDARTYMEPTFKERKVDFRNLVKSPPLPKVKADVLLMKVVFINLIRNSFEAGARRITVRGRLTTIDIGGFKKEAVELTFEDDGGGIQESDWENIFEPFHTAFKKRGTGVGLYVNRNILNSHDGETMVVSSTVGVGTTIAVTWPLDLE